MTMCAATGAVMLLLALAGCASARTLLADSAPAPAPAANKKPEFVFSNELLAKAASTKNVGEVPPLPAATPGGRANATIVPVRRGGK